MYKILLAEDDADMRFIYSRMSVWKECGFVIAKEVSNGKDALAVLKAEAFDLVLTDIRMPFIDGIELLGKINELGIDVAVAFISSYDEFEYARKGLVLGAFDYLLKPVNEQKLWDMLRRVSESLQRRRLKTPAPTMCFRHLKPWAKVVTTALLRISAHIFQIQAVGIFQLSRRRSISASAVTISVSFSGGR